MTAITFPNSPSSGDTHTAGNGIVYTYDGEKWTSIGTNSAGTWTRSGTEVTLTNAGDDLNVDSGTLFVDASTNNVGIGTTSPSNPLSVYHATINNVALFESGDANCEIAIADNTGRAAIGNAGDNLRFLTSSSGTERVRIDSSGRLLVGTSTATNNVRFEQKLGLVAAGTNPYPGLSITAYGSVAGGVGSTIDLQRSRGGTDGVMTSVASNDRLGIIIFRGADGSSFQDSSTIESIVEGTPAAGKIASRLEFSTTANGASSPTERMRITNGGQIQLADASPFRAKYIYDTTTAGAASVYVSPLGYLYRSTSSLKYKTNVETLQNEYADAILNCRPVWYQSTSQVDNPDWGYWGFIAEEVAEIDPRLVEWRTFDVTINEEGESIETPLAEPLAEGVQYDRFVPHLLNLIKRQKEQIEAIEARLSALEAA